MQAKFQLPRTVTEYQAVLRDCLKNNNTPLIMKVICKSLRYKAEANFLKQAITLLRINEGETILNYAIENNEELTDTLVTHKLFPTRFYNIKNNKGFSPIWIAIKQKNFNFVGIALKEGANPNCTDPTGETLLEFATARFNYELIELLFANKDIDVPDNLIPKLFQKSLTENDENNRTNIIKILIQNECNLIPVLKSDYDTCSFYVKFLIKNGCNLSHLDKLAYTLDFNKLPENGHAFEQELIDLLVKEINERTQFKNSACLLFWASRYDSNSKVYNVPQEIFSNIQKITYFPASDLIHKEKEQQKHSSKIDQPPKKFDCSIC